MVLLYRKWGASQSDERPYCYNKAMDENPIARPGAPPEAYQRLGVKTLMAFILKNIQASMVLLLSTVGFFLLKDQPLLKTTPFGDARPYANLAAWGVLILFAMVFALTFFITWLIYINYKFFLGDNALKIKRGILNKEEIAIPYRQIQDVDITRDLGFQMMGLSRIVILTAGHDDDKPGDDRTEGVLPAVDKDLAGWLQSELLKRANVQKVVETK